MLCIQCGYTSSREGGKCPACNATISPQESSLALARATGFSVFDAAGADAPGDFDIPAGFDNQAEPGFAEISLPDLPAGSPVVENFDLDLSDINQ